MSVSGGSEDGVIYSDPEEANDLFSDGEAHEASDREDRQGDDGNQNGTPAKKPKVDKPKKKGPVVRQMLSEDELCGKNGLIKLEEIFKDFEFGKEKGQEKKDLDRMLHKLEHWAHLLHPKYPFAQVLERIEYLGIKRRAVKTCVKKIRMGLLTDDPLHEDPLPVEHLDDEPLDNDPLLDDPLPDEHLDDEPLDNDPLLDDPLPDEPLDDDLLLDDPLPDEPLDDDLLLDDPLPDEHLHDKPLDDDPLDDDSLSDDDIQNSFNSRRRRRFNVDVSDDERENDG